MAVFAPALNRPTEFTVVALEEALETPPDRESLRLRAEDFSVQAGVLKTLQTLELAEGSAA